MHDESHLSGASTLTDFEVIGLRADLNLADGHAYQDLSDDFSAIVVGLSDIWHDSEQTRVPEAEQRFRSAFASLAGSPTMANLSFFKICPSASNSIDVVATTLATLRRRTMLVEPTFDNLSLLLRRRGVVIDAVREKDLRDEAMLLRLLQDDGGALFLVQPNNPTGYCLSSSCLRSVAEQCRRKDKVLVLDNSFRFFNRAPFDDYAILAETGVSFIAFEDTGKVWATHDLKASLLFCSADLEDVVSAVYKEIYLCNSRFALSILERFLFRTLEMGIERAVWSTVDRHRRLLRNALAGTSIVVDPASLASDISVEWLNTEEAGLRDFDVTSLLARAGVLVLPGRQFYWHSHLKPERQYNIRVALLKPAAHFSRAIESFRATLIRRSPSQ